MNLDLETILSHNSDLEVIKLLLNNEAQEAFQSALNEFSMSAPVIKKDATGVNLACESYQYAKLEEIQKEIKQHLFDNGLSYRFNQKQRGDVVTVQCVITHTKGHSITATMSAPIEQTDKLVSEQKTATSTSYLKRYTLVNALGLIIEGQDTDANPQQPKPTIEEIKAPVVDVPLAIENDDEDIDDAINNLVFKEEEERKIRKFEVIATERLEDNKKVSLDEEIHAMSLSEVDYRAVKEKDGVIDFWIVTACEDAMSIIRNMYCESEVFINVAD